MTRFHHLLLALSMAVLPAVSACEREQEGPAVDTDGGIRTFTCVFAANADSKFSLSESGKTAWEPGDEIMIHGGTNGTGRYKVTLTADDISADGKTARFTVEGLAPYDRSDKGIVSTYYAQYPASAVPEGKMYYDSCFDSTNHPLMAACNVGNVFAFYNLCGVISYRVSGDIDKVVFCGNNGETVSYDYYQARVRDEGDGPLVEYHKPGNGFPNYTPIKSLESGVVADGTTVNRLYIPAGADFTKGFRFAFYKGTTFVGMVKTDKSVNLTPGKLLRLGDLTSRISDSDPEAERLARLGQTPIVAVYFTEYTSSSEFPTLEDVKCFTHINAGHARFVNKTTGDGGLEVKSPGYSYMQRLAAYKKDYPELKLLLFIGGWGKNADGFSMMARDPAKRALFCSECVRLCDELNFDGVDIDWEYPTYSADAGKDGFVGTGADPSDTENFTILVKELREALGPNRLISYAAADNGQYINNAEVLEWVDYINVMTYSMGNPPKKHNSPLYKSPLISNSRAGADCIEIFHNQGVPYDRLNYGLAFYGHGDGTIYPSSMQYYKIQEALETGQVDGKSVEGYNIRVWDEQGKNVYLGDANGTMYSSYEDVESLSYRVAFAKEKGLLGVFAWEYREDAKDGTLRKAVRKMMDGEPVDPEPEPEPGPDPASCTDLSESGTANCYIVTAAGSYKFKAVKGNSNTSIGTVAKTEILWETWCGGDTVTSGSLIASVGYQDGYVSFETPDTFHAGNALIAAKDASGKILWSWHIWMPSTAIQTGTYSLASKPIMDRYLGALKAASGTAKQDGSVFGLFYQWGRKDPFPGMQSSSSSKVVKVSGTGTTITRSTVSTAGAIAAPTVFYTLNNADWNSSTDNDLWGGVSGSKTIYDPCPPGYKVPRCSEAASLFTDLTGVTGWSGSISDYTISVGSPVTVFPLAGYIDDYIVNPGTYYYPGDRTTYWSADYSPTSDASATLQDVRKGSSDFTSTLATKAKARGASVRCIKE